MGQMEDKAFSKRDLSSQLRKRYKLLEISIDVLRNSYSEFQICYATIEEFLNPKIKNKIKNLSLDYLYNDIISRWTDLVMYKETHCKLEFSKEAMDIDFVGPVVIEQLYEKGMVKTPADLYKLTQQDFMQLDLVKEKSASNMYFSIQNSKNRPLSRFITALSIRHVGKETADFTVNIEESGVYTVVVDAHHAKGTIHIQLKEEI